jgi:hypothetical protein
VIKGRPRHRALLAWIGSLLFSAAMLLASACGSGGSGGSVTGPTPTPAPAPTSTPAPENALGFVVSSFGYVFPTHQAEACPGGFNQGPVEMGANGGTPLPDDCGAPEANVDPGFRTLEVPGVLDGFDLDGVTSSRDSPQPGECPHDDFAGPGGEPGLDDQLWRAIGCIRGFQKGEIVDGVVENAVRDGSMTILVEAQGVDDPRNDDAVTVQVFSSPDAPPVGGDGSVLPYGTLGVDPDTRYHSQVASGRIADGVLTAGPMDVRVRLNIQIVEGDLVFRDAWVRLELGDDGTVDGRIYGYAPIVDTYDVFGLKAGRIGGKEALGYTCSGLYAALQSQADGHPDPVTGRCTTLSVAYRFAGLPAFVAR